jgi:hypothetical protein
MSQGIGFNFGFASANVGGGSGNISGAGTPPKIPKYITPTTIGDSQMSDDGTTVFIGAAATSTTALFELSSTTQGFLAPRMDESERDLIAAPATGLFIYNTDTDQFNYYNGTAWEIIESTVTADDWENVLTAGNTSGANDAIWSKTGTATSTATQVGSQIASFQTSLWDGAAEDVQLWDIKSIASTTVDQESRLAFLIDGVEKGAFYSNSFGVGTGTITPTATVQFRGADLLSTSDALLVENSAGTLSMKVQNNNDVVMNGHASVGSGSITLPTAVFRVAEVSTSTIMIGSQILLAPDATLAATYAFTGAQNGVNIRGTLYSAGSIVVGAQNTVYPLGAATAGSGSLDAYGAQNVIFNTIGSTTTYSDIYGSQSSIGAPLFGTGTMTFTNGYNFHVADNSAGITATNMYGLYIEPLTAATNNYGIISLTNLNGFGVSVPTSIIHLAAGTATASTAPLKFTTGTLLTVPETGAMEYASEFFYLTTNSLRSAISTVARTVVSTASYVVLVTDRVLGVTRTATGTSAITLPLASLFPAGYEITIKDEGNNAAANNITITPAVGDTIDTAATLVISTDLLSRTIYSDGGTAWFIK